VVLTYLEVFVVLLTASSSDLLGKKPIPARRMGGAGVFSLLRAPL
jgi:hypothetical protein